MYSNISTKRVCAIGPIGPIEARVQELMLHPPKSPKSVKNLKRESSLKQLLEVIILKGAEKSQSEKYQELNFRRNSEIFFECLLEITKCLKHEFETNFRGKDTIKNQ
jgi:hypothetical protein